MAITTDIDRFRLELGDTPAAYGILTDANGDLTDEQQAEFEESALFNDEEIAYFLDGHPSSVLLAVAAACDALAARFARDVDIAEDGQSFKDSQIAKGYLAMAARFRQRARDEEVAVQTNAGLPVGTVPTGRPATTWREAF